MTELNEALNRNRALDLAADLFKCGDIGADDIVTYAEQFCKFLNGPGLVKAVPEPDWTYFVDEENPYSDSAYFRRIKGNDTSTSQFLGGYWLWRFGDNVDRDYMVQAGYREIRFEELPDWVKEIS